nr:MAG TPA: hypothetical protein [Caudoviricetes sp.]
MLSSPELLTHLKSYITIFFGFTSGLLVFQLKLM